VAGIRSSAFEIHKEAFEFRTDELSPAEAELVALAGSLVFAFPALVC
jgi:hypothetical protein